MSRQEFDKFAEFMAQRQRLRVKRFKQGFVTWIVMMVILVGVWYVWLYPKHQERQNRPATQPSTTQSTQPGRSQTEPGPSCIENGFARHDGG